VNTAVVAHRPLRHPFGQRPVVEHDLEPFGEQFPRRPRRRDLQGEDSIAPHLEGEVAGEMTDAQCAVLPRQTRNAPIATRTMAMLAKVLGMRPPGYFDSSLLAISF